ncbi:hypothetical protein BLNAU_10643 [Blattamonas nauphoetae]|uniref:Uncharacterized protein n=1 Tax=Blattamonas nauphoetae TaxID=2049346 RepID=A0ABQ9XPT7_9EUKA|nr:hypothetical protein BLNAU_18744 [Blattamonas nauphoetae]KAK2949779.1 hypothetical protein BLNAU_15261 [Blattamonas nauphoetae]KAK2954433.1 hypothetical protein BLNAU_10601 [Blattamonas nauphoetae]KAK2954475.1 hypothetical protein BLNAU_10643 [Blattamonas nauphoetae]
MFPFLTCAGNLTNCIPLCVLSTDRAGRDGRGRERLRDDCVEERECEPVVSDPFSAASNSLSISSDAQPVHTTHPHSQIAKSEERRRPVFPQTTLETQHPVCRTPARRTPSGRTWPCQKH